ncbi:MAG: aminotransferase class V-fold PLP-dependent enzyme [Spirochaetaceae bacterium]|jgi:cysteine desulfurase|nr:aminotransferase class V-fold PLP-dependent enzyme [Spirochaetaceae bacterium]
METGYFDWAATAVADPALSMNVLFGNAPFGNPSSKHAAGRAAKAAYEEARSRCAGVLGAGTGTEPEIEPRHVYFTGSGTEANAIVLHSFLRRKLESGGTGAVLYSAVEHPSIRENCLLLQHYGMDVREIAVEGDGRVSAAALEKAFAAGKAPAFVTVMAVNNETGSVNDIGGLVSWIRGHSERPVHVHVDCVQALGKMPLPLKAWDIDSASFSAHKICGPRGIGILYLRKPLIPPWLGGGQERGLRPGTENIAGALSFAAALEKYAAPGPCEKHRMAAAERMARLVAGLNALGRGRFHIIPACRPVSLVGGADTGGPDFSPYILQASFDGIPGEVFARALDEKGFCISTGSACSSAKTERPVLFAIGVNEKQRLEGVRFSQGYATTNAAIDALLGAVGEVLKIL